MDLRILLADDHRMVRDGLRALIQLEPGLQVVGEADDGQEAVELARRLHPDVVVLDVAMPVLNGIDASRQICAEQPDVGIIALSQHADKRLVTAMFRAGARGYLLKKNAFHELARAIHVVVEGKLFVSPQIAGMVAGDFANRTSVDASSRFSELTGREREVLQLLVEGWAAERIADALHISVNTVSTHRYHIMEKLGIRTLPELTKFAIREGITFLDD
ncbi:MAG: response regulator transcription factor [Candidatus Latescibacterota bacterium]